jgi:hypothetical protein
VETFVLIPRYVRASDSKVARRTAELSGFSCIIRPAPLAGYVLVEFSVALRREEAVVVEAFEMEIDDLLHSKVAAGWRRSRSVTFRGSGSRVELR